MLILENISIKKFTTFKIGGRVKYFITITTLKEVEELIDFLSKKETKFFILGGGSNILFTDEYYNGVVIKPKFETFNFFQNGEVVLGANKLMSEVVYESCRLGYQGLEWAGGLPGELGGAIRGNAGCFGSEIKDIVQEVLAVNLLTKELKKFSNEECQFAYRHSFFKKNPEWLIVETKLILNPGSNSESLLKIMNEKINYRKDKHPLEFPNVGSIFKNLNIEEVNFELKKLAEKNKVIKGNKIPTAFVIEFLGLKGKQIGGAKISEKHANFIVNVNNAKAQDVLDLIKFIKEKVKEEFNLDLKEEIEIIS
ncbi:MAG: UDP-N-acetylmuramate dehydrogenase [Patescibacteria group bacterium]|nr:UDP-N-acetylmuramate dehydrogenase [Patescibacteria group bacterium]